MRRENGTYQEKIKGHKHEHKHEHTHEHKHGHGKGKQSNDRLVRPGGESFLAAFALLAVLALSGTEGPSSPSDHLADGMCSLEMDEITPDDIIEEAVVAMIRVAQQATGISLKISPPEPSNTNGNSSIRASDKGKKTKDKKIQMTQKAVK